MQVPWIFLSIFVKCSHSVFHFDTGTFDISCGCGHSKEVSKYGHNRGSFLHQSPSITFHFGLEVSSVFVSFSPSSRQFSVRMIMHSAPARAAAWRLFCLPQGKHAQQ